MNFKNMKKQKYKKYLLLCIPTLVCLLIFHNSMYPIAQSNLQSGFVLRSLNRFLAGIGFHHVLTQFAVRKLAHFTEYFFFGLLLTLSVRVMDRKLKHAVTFELFLFLAVAVLDETIQLRSNGRNSSVIDVWIDFAGCIAGMGLNCLIHHWRNRPKKLSA